DQADHVVVGAGIAAIVDIAVPVHLRVQAHVPRQVGGWLERELRDGEARHAIEAVDALLHAAVAQAARPAFLPTRCLRAAPAAQVEQRAQRHAGFLRHLVLLCRDTPGPTQNSAAAEHERDGELRSDARAAPLSLSRGNHASLSSMRPLVELRRTLSPYAADREQQGVASWRWLGGRAPKGMTPRQRTRNPWRAAPTRRSPPGRRSPAPRAPR